MCEPSFAQAVEQAIPHGNVCKPGLRALREKGVLEIRRGSLAGSVFLDHALRDQYPHAPRWDYLVGWHSPSQLPFLICIEVHGNRPSDVIAKARWLDSWLHQQGSALLKWVQLKTRIRKFWVLRGQGGGKRGRYAKALALHGIQRKRFFCLPDDL